MNKIEREIEKKKKELEEAIRKYNEYDDESITMTNQLFNRCRVLRSYIKGLEFALECLKGDE